MSMVTRLDGAQRAYLESARSSAEHLLGLVNDLLDYARLEAGKLEFDAAPVDLEGLVRGVAELLEFVKSQGFSTADVTHWYRHSEGMEYRMVVHSLDATAVRRMSDALRQRTDIAEFRISPTGD